MLRLLLTLALIANVATAHAQTECQTNADCNNGEQCMSVKTSCAVNPESSTCAARQCIAAKPAMTMAQAREFLSTQNYLTCTAATDCTLAQDPCHNVIAVNRQLATQYAQAAAQMSSVIECDAPKKLKSYNFGCVQNSCTLIQE